MRIDKYDPIDGGFRAPLAATYAGSTNAVGVGLDVNGRVVVGAGNTGIKGILCNPGSTVPGATTESGAQVDVMTDGEIVGFNGAAGTNYYCTSAGVITATASGNTYIGHTVEATRLIVRVAR